MRHDQQGDDPQTQVLLRSDRDQTVEPWIVVSAPPIPESPARPAGSIHFPQFEMGQEAGPSGPSHLTARIGKRGGKIARDHAPRTQRGCSVGLIGGSFQRLSLAAQCRDPYTVVLVVARWRR
jgi:hypothetical protein